MLNKAAQYVLRAGACKKTSNLLSNAICLLMQLDLQLLISTGFLYAFNISRI